MFFFFNFELCFTSLLCSIPVSPLFFTSFDFWRISHFFEKVVGVFHLLFCCFVFRHFLVFFHLFLNFLFVGSFLFVSFFLSLWFISLFSLRVIIFFSLQQNLFVSCWLLPFCHLLPDIILFLLFHSFFVVFNMFSIPLSPCFYSFYLGCFFSKTITPCSNFYFHLSHSNPYFSLSFSPYFDSLHVSSLFTYPPDVHSFSCWTVSFQKHCVIFSFSKTFVFHSVAFFAVFFISFCENPLIFLLLFVSSFFILFLFVQSCSFEKCLISLPKRKFSSNISQNCFSEVLFFFFLKIFKNCSFIIFCIFIFYENKVLNVWEKMSFLLLFVFKNLISFFEKWAKKKLKRKNIQISFVAISGVFKKKKILFFLGKHVVLDTKHQKLREKKSWTKKRGDKEVRSEMTLKKEGIKLFNKKFFFGKRIDKEIKKRNQWKKTKKMKKKEKQKKHREKQKQLQKKRRISKHEMKKEKITKEELRYEKKWDQTRSRKKYLFFFELLRSTTSFTFVSFS